MHKFLLQIQFFRENIPGDEKEEHRHQDSEDGGDQEITVVGDRVGAAKQAVARDDQHDGAENLCPRMDADIRQDGSHDPMLPPQLPDGDAGKKHERSVEKPHNHIEKHIENISAEIHI